jgi:hypothetical protein
MTANERRLALRSVSALAAACLLAPAPAAAMNGSGKLSPQLAALVGGSKQARALASTAPGASGLERDGQRVIVSVRFDRGAVGSLPRLRSSGAEVVDSSRRYQAVTVAVKSDELPSLSRIAGVASISAARAPIVAGLPSGPSISAAAAPCFGAATSEGDLQLNAMKARDGFKVNGSGVTVGILSDSFNHDPAADTNASADIASGDLPGLADPCHHTTPTQIVPEGDGVVGSDEGRAMAQIVHDLAPGADLAFATAFPTELAFAKDIEKLTEAGAQVIVDDVFYPEEPFFQDGPVAVAVNEAVEAGVTYLSAAGNDNLIDGQGRDIASWEAPKFRDSGGCPSPLVQLSEEIEEAEGPGVGLEPDHCMDFDPAVSGSDSTFGITVSKGATLVADLQWAEPRGGVDSDLDAYLFNPSGKLLDDSIEDNASPTGTQEPVEVVEWENDTGTTAHVQLVINRYSGTEESPLKFALLENGSGVTATEFPESSEGDTVGPTIFGHSASASALSVAAVPYFDGEAPERYSSRGPVTHYFGPVAGIAAAEPIEPPEVIAKPDVAATDGGANTFFGSCVSHVWRFFGTSAAAPHAAAVAALAIQAQSEFKPGEPASPAEIGEALASSAAPVGAFPPEAVGGGLVDAPAAISALTETPFPGSEQAAPPTLQNCGFSSPPVPSSSSPVAPPVSAPPSAHRSPRTFFRQRPSRVVRTRHRRARVVFSFGSNLLGATFVCRIDSGLFRPCRQRIARWFPIGHHTVKVAARDAAEGTGDGSPAVYRFRVKRIG